MKNEAKITNIRTSIVGTIQFDMAAKGHRGTQNFICYPMTGDDETVKIQSDKRIGKYCPESGRMLLSKSRSGGSYFHHLQTDDLTGVHLDPLENQELKMKIFTTSGKKVGNSVLSTDNSGAINIFDL